MIRPPTVMSRLAAVATGKSTGVSEVLPDGTVSKYETHTYTKTQSHSKNSHSLLSYVCVCLQYAVAQGRCEVQSE
jgi:hypothetical protein